jgi:hypothetical protein
MRPTKIIETSERRNSGLHSADFYSIQKQIGSIPFGNLLSSGLQHSNFEY